MTGDPGFDPAALGDDAGRTVRELLLGTGCTPDELDAAEREGTLPLLAVERLIVPEAAELDIAAVADQTGLDVDTVRHLWRTLGYPVPRDDEVVFTRVDAEILSDVGRLLAGDVASDELVLQMSRVIGSSMARIASSQVDAISARAAGGRAGAELSDGQIVLSASALLPMVPAVLEATWRRHLQGAVRRRLSTAGAGQGHVGVVGFADLVGFTALSQRVGDEELAAVVGEFEQLAFDVVTADGGRVVKMIGDEVMFTVDAPVTAAEIGLALAEGTRGADELSDVRVGMAYGPMLEREGDLYGAVVNLASRITAIAFPGSILVSDVLGDALAHDDRYRLRAMRPRSIKGIGRVHLSVLRRPGHGGGTSGGHPRARRSPDDAADGRHRSGRPPAAGMSDTSPPAV